MDRLARPSLREALKEVAQQAGVCVRPQPFKRVDRVTGRYEWVDLPCKSRQASKCKPCAEVWRRLQKVKIEAGWHLTEEPVPVPEKPCLEVRRLLKLRADLVFERFAAEMRQDWPAVDQYDARVAQLDEELAGQRVRGTLPKPDTPRQPRKVRSTRRRPGVPDLPRRTIRNISVGRVIVGKDGSRHQDSTLLTTTLGSFGPVHSGTRTRRGKLVPCDCGQMHGQRDPLLGTPLDPDSYDYRAHALGLIHFGKAMDAFWTNLRRAVGMKVAYSGAIEMQRRLAVHGHFAVRGTFPRQLVKQVAAGSYDSVWWPHFDTLRYTPDKPPTWDETNGWYTDPETGRPLLTWDDAMTGVDHTDTPAYVARLGSVDVRGIKRDTADAKQTIRYITKYITKDLVDQVLIKGDPQKQHAERLHAQLSVLPCSQRCANWLLYGIEPDVSEAQKPKLVPGACKGQVHQRSSLGYTGRRCPTSQNWSGKTLSDHREDQRDYMRAAAVLLGQQQADADDNNRHYYVRATSQDEDIPRIEDRLLRAIGARTRRQAARAAAQALARNGSAIPVTTVAA